VKRSSIWMSSAAWTRYAKPSLDDVAAESNDVMLRSARLDTPIYRRGAVIMRDDGLWSTCGAGRTGGSPSRAFTSRVLHLARCLG
jgi:hypothetical protein